MTIRYGLIGSGMMGQEHIRNLTLLDGCEVTAIADPDEGMRALSVETSGGKAQAFSDYKEMLSSGLVDALVIVSPNDTHHAILMDVLDTRPADPVRKAALHHLRPLPRGGREGRGPRRAGLGGDGIPLHAAGPAPARGDRQGDRRHPPDDGDPRTPLSFPREGRRLEPVQRPHRRHAGGEMLPLLGPDAAHAEERPGARLRLRARRM